MVSGKVDSQDKFLSPRLDALAKQWSANSQQWLGDLIGSSLMTPMHRYGRFLDSPELHLHFWNQYLSQPLKNCWVTWEIKLPLRSYKLVGFGDFRDIKVKMWVSNMEGNSKGPLGGAWAKRRVLEAKDGD